MWAKRLHRTNEPLLNTTTHTLALPFCLYRGRLPSRRMILFSTETSWAWANVAQP